MITLIGSNSQLAKCFQSISLLPIDAISSDDLDLRNYKDIATHLSKYKNKILLNFSAYNDVEGAEIDSDADLINNVAVGEIAKHCSNQGIFLCHISSDFVFDGLKGDYAESDPTNPINKYGQSKLDGEQLIQRHCKNFIIIRTSWLYSHLDTQNNFLSKMKSILQKNHQELVGADNIFGSPTSAMSLAKAINHFLLKSRIGSHQNLNMIYHYADVGRVSRYEYLCEITSLINHKFNLQNTVIKAPNSFFQLKAPRPQDTSLNSLLFSKTFSHSSQCWKSSLSETINLL